MTSYFAVLVSFDIDDTLVPGTPAPFALETSLGQRILARLFREGLRLGTIQLFHELRRRGHGVALYTTSHRSRWWLRVRFLLSGVPLVKIVNGDTHRRAVEHLSAPPSKLPSLFGIDLHVDDSVGVLQEGATHGFAVLHVGAHDSEWTSRVLEAVGD
ncbi:MAG: hypothetical protein AAF657_14735 [Acidobacteriota bacterium]